MMSKNVIKIVFSVVILALVAININTYKGIHKGGNFILNELITKANAEDYEITIDGLFIHEYYMKSKLCWTLVSNHNSYWKTCCPTFRSVMCNVWAQKTCDICGGDLKTCAQLNG